MISLKVKNNATVGGLRAMEHYFRPIGNALSGETLALQSAFRMNSPSRGVIFPGEYLPVLEAYPDRAADFIPLAFYHLYDAVENFKSRDMDYRFISIPMPVSFMKRPECVAGIGELAKAFHIKPEFTCFELSAALYEETDDTVVKVMRALQKEGYSFMLNSFGGEDSPTVLLSNFPVDYVMLNGLYTKESVLGERHEGWVRAAASYIASLDCTPIATEVENSTQGDKLASLGCDMCVGSYTGDWTQRRYLRIRTGDELDQPEVQNNENNDNDDEE